MTNILLNVSNFHESWAYEALAPYLNQDSHVLILPLSYQEGWITDAMEWRDRYGKGTKLYDELVEPFFMYGVKERNIRWINYYEDTHASAVRKIEEADVLFFTGGYPDWMMQRLYDLGIQETIRAYDGIVMGTSAGALIQLDEFHLTPEEDYEYQYQEGLGLLSGFDIEVHYEDTPEHILSMIRALEDTGKTIAVLPNKGGLLIEEGRFELLGEAFLLDLNDLDELYQAYDSLTGW